MFRVIRIFCSVIIYLSASFLKLMILVPIYMSNRLPACSPCMCEPHQDDLWQCVEEARCASNDDEWLQLAVMRDPRAVTVSSYFHILKYFPKLLKTVPSVDAYFQQKLAVLCMWTTIRYLLFTMVFADQSKVFFFEEMFLDPVDWYGRFFSFIGLKLPFEFVFGLSQRTGNMGNFNEHPGGHNDRNRTFTVELNAESLGMMDDVMRIWLPRVLLTRFGVLPYSM